MGLNELPGAFSRGAWLLEMFQSETKPRKVSVESSVEFLLERTT
jgi:hypothetical protein